MLSAGVGCNEQGPVASDVPLLFCAISSAPGSDQRYEYIVTDHRERLLLNTSKEADSGLLRTIRDVRRLNPSTTSTECGSNLCMYLFRIEVFAAVSMKMAVFWVVAPCSQGDRPDDGGSKDLWNVGKTLPDYTVLQPRRQTSSLKMLPSWLNAYSVPAEHVAVNSWVLPRNFSSLISDDVSLFSQSEGVV
jgi:hypothetical protein